LPKKEVIFFLKMKWFWRFSIIKCEEKIIVKVKRFLYLFFNAENMEGWLKICVTFWLINLESRVSQQCNSFNCVQTFFLLPKFCQDRKLKIFWKWNDFGGFQSSNVRKRQ
jgi:hypothetical protein